MKNKNLPYLIGGGLLLLGVGGYFLYNYIQDQKDLKDSREDKGDDTPTSTDKPVSSSLSDSFPISKGTMKNRNVQELQRVLKRDADGNLLVIDGSWGNKTESAMAFWGLNGVTIKDNKNLSIIIDQIIKRKGGMSDEDILKAMEYNRNNPKLI